MKGALTLLAVASLCASGASAQPAGFSEQMDAALAPAGDLAPFLRCTGLYQAFRLLAGAETEVGAEALEGEIDLAIVSSVLRQRETGATRDEVMEEIAPLIAAAAQLYLDRMVDNDDETDSVMDEGLTETLSACATLRRDYMGDMETEGE
jgi:hypothetical protein